MGDSSAKGQGKLPFRVSPDKNGTIAIGIYKENIVREVAFPLPELGEGGHYQAKLQRPHDEAPYPLASRVEGQTLIWLVSLADTSDPGEGLVEIRWDGPNGETWKSPQYAVMIAKGLADPKEAPEAWAGFLQQVSRDAGRAESAADRAGLSADNAANTLKKLEDGIASGDFRGEKGEKGEKGDPGPQGPKGEAGPAGDTTAADAAAEAAKQAAQEAQKAAEASAGSAAQAAESVGGLADDLETTQKDIAKMKRAIKFQAELNKGQTWDFETDTQEAYQRQVPSGAKAGAVMEWGGKTMGWNQLCDALPNPGTYKGVKVSVSNGKVSLSGTATDTVLIGVGYAAVTVSGHKYMATGLQGGSKSTFYVQGVNENNGYYNILDSTAIFAATGAKYRYNIIAVAGTVFAHTFQPMVVDLTLMFGPGNEPTDTSDPRIAQIEAYAAAHPEYNAGELVSALVDEVRVVGRNLVSAVVPNKTSRGVNLKSNGDGTYIINGTATGGMANFESEKFMLTKGKKYKLVGAPPDASLTKFYSYLRNHGGYTQYLSEVSGRTFIAEFDEYIAGFDVKAGNTVNNVIWKPMVVENSDATYADYSPWHKETYPIPSAVKALPGYGWSAGSVGNTIERTENGWQYVQRVGSVDLWTLRWSPQKISIGAYRYQITLPLMLSNTKNIVTAAYSYVGGGTWTGEIGIGTYYSIIQIFDSAYSDGTAESLAAFKAHVTGVPLYYELATPITTDITALMGDALAPFAVEAGGSITMHHPKADEGFAIDVPAKIQYITKLSEVSANG